MGIAAKQPVPRGNRQGAVLDAAAHLFRHKGYAGTSLRAIAQASGMLAGSIYFHFDSKEDIFLAVQEQGIRHVTSAVTRAMESVDDPWERLTAACAAHMSAILDESDYAAVLIKGLPGQQLTIADQLTRMRDAYEDRFRNLVDDLPLPRGSNRKYLRLAVLGAMNWSQTWYRPGRDEPQRIAREFITLLRRGLGEAATEDSA